MRESREGLRQWLQGHANVTLIDGPGALRSRRAWWRVGDRSSSAERIFINVGGRAARARPAGRRRRARSSTAARSWSVDSLPEHLVIVGGSYIGLEFAQMYRRFGAPRDGGRDGAAAAAARGRGRLARDPRDPRGARASTLRTACRVHRARAGAATASRSASSAARARRWSTAATCCSPSAAGRTPRSSGLDAAGIATDARGYIEVDDAAAHQRRGRLGARRLQRPRRLHAHVVQRLRDRRRQPVRRRHAPRQRAHRRPTPSSSTRRSAASA